MSQPPFGRRNPANSPAMATPAPVRTSAPVRAYAPPPEMAPRPGENWLATGVDLFFNPNGRLSRRQYRSVRYSMLILFAALVRLLSLSWKMTKPTAHAADLAYPLTMIVITLLLAGLFFACGVVLTIKRWHDLDKSAWWALIGGVPVIGWIWQLVQCNFTQGTPGANRYGPEPAWK